MPIKVHPGIGVARVGDSPEFFTGPETPFDRTAPTGGFRDAECRIKRQAALFRVYEHNADGTFSEITANATTTITWSVRIRTAAFDDDEVSLAHPDPPMSVTASGTELAELHTDPEGRLLLCPIRATIGSIFDTRCEGYVHASVVRDGTTLEAVDPSWVVIYPPDFAPGLHPGGGGAAATLLVLWPEAPATSPALPYTDQLDRGPLWFVGAWDAASAFGALAADAFAEPFRFVTAGPPSSLRHGGYADWASDLRGFADDTTSGCSSQPSWLSGVAVDDTSTPPTGTKGADWRYRGFLAEQADASLEYVDWCPVITAPAEVNFYQVPRGTTRAVPIPLELKNFPEETRVSSSIVGQPNASLESDTLDTPVVPENHTIPVTVWAFFSAGPETPLGTATGTIEFSFDERHIVSIPLRAEVVEPSRLAVALVLDCSTSMNRSRGDTRSRLEGLKDAVNVLIDVARPGSAMAVAPFSTVALDPLAATILGSGDAADEGAGGARKAVRDFVRNLSTIDLTAIGAGIESGQVLVISEPVADFEDKALIVVTDGYETASPYVRDVADTITTRMFAIGIGPAFEPALRDIVGDTGGFVSIMGSPLSDANRYELEKYFLQAFAAVTGDIVVDPQGELAPGARHRIPFSVSDAEMGLDLIVVSDVASKLSIAVEGPTGEIRSLEQLRDTGRCRVTRTRRVGHAELAVPFAAGSATWGPGTWAIQIANVGGQPPFGIVTHGFGNQFAQDLPKAATYLAMVTTASALRLNPSIRRGVGEVVLEAALSYGGAPILRTPDLFVELTTPWGHIPTVPLTPASPGLFRARIETTRPGGYRAAFRARGRSLRGHAFQRERVVEEFFADGDGRRCPHDDCTCPGGPLKRCAPLRRLEHRLHGLLKRVLLHRRC